MSRKDPGKAAARDRSFLARAAELALKGRGWVEPNPMVGALVVKGDRVIGRGWHRAYGGPHAEIFALRSAGTDAKGAVLYVSLEPCSSHGKTPPCTEAVRAAGVRRVVVGALDPDPRHDGRGLRVLRRAGIRAEYVPEEGCGDLRDRFDRHLRMTRPYVILKWAMTLDGRIAAGDGSSKWISGTASRRTVHRMRGHVDGVLVGARTARLDAPRLNCRIKGAPLHPVRVVLDPACACLCTPPSCGLRERSGITRGFPWARPGSWYARACGREKPPASPGRGW